MFYEIIYFMNCYFSKYALLIIPFVIFFITVVPMPVPEDLFLLLFGFLAKRSNINLTMIIIVSYIMVQLSDLLLYYAGSISEVYLRKKLFSKLFFIKKKISVGSVYFSKYGVITIIIARFTFLLRSSVYLAAGFLKYNKRKFIIINGAAGIIQTPLLIFIGYQL